MSPQSRLVPAPTELEDRGRTYRLLGYDSDGRPHYHLESEHIHAEHVARVDGELYRVGHLSDEQASALESDLASSIFGGEQQ